MKTGGARGLRTKCIRRSLKQCQTGIRESRKLRGFNTQAQPSTHTPHDAALQRWLHNVMYCKISSPQQRHGCDSARSIYPTCPVPGSSRGVVNERVRRSQATSNACSTECSEVNTCRLASGNSARLDQLANLRDVTGTVKRKRQENARLLRVEVVRTDHAGVGNALGRRHTPAAAA